MDARVDITDIFAFQNPADPTRSVLAMNVNPVAPTLADSFAPGAVYELVLDTDGDTVADVTYSVTFSPRENGDQKAPCDAPRAKRRGTPRSRARSSSGTCRCPSTVTPRSWGAGTTSFSSASAAIPFSSTSKGSSTTSSLLARTSSSTRTCSP